jgi:hypothetical protein
MRLPDHIYHVSRPVFDHHASWHVARDPRFPGHVAARRAFPELRLIHEAGAGEEFLRFHRVMVRHFKWIITETRGPAYVYEPWSRLPGWLEAQFRMIGDLPAGYVGRMYEEIERLVVEGTADDLGNFIEATRVRRRRFDNVHNLSHGLIAAYEEREHSGDPRLFGADMADPGDAPHNEFFWRLHGWIDDIFARWQRAHGEEVDQSPASPHDGGHHHHLMVAGRGGGDVSSPIAETDRKWGKERLPPGALRDAFLKIAFSVADEE